MLLILTRVLILGRHFREMEWISMKMLCRALSDFSCWRSGTFLVSCFFGYTACSSHSSIHSADAITNISNVKLISLYKLQYLNECHVILWRSAGKSNLSAGDLVSKLEEGCTQWPKASLQVVHKLWTEQGPLVHSQQEVQALLSIGQACLFLLLYSNCQCRGSLGARSILNTVMQ